jgi:hypothetical protein
MVVLTALTIRDAGALQMGESHVPKYGHRISSLTVTVLHCATPGQALLCPNQEWR